MSDIIFNEEKDFEEAVIKALIEHGWESDVIRYPSEEDLIQNWANILFNNNKQGTRLNDQPLTSGEMAQILDQVRNLQSPMALLVQLGMLLRVWLIRLSHFCISLCRMKDHLRTMNHGCLTLWEDLQRASKRAKAWWLRQSKVYRRI